MRASFQHNPQVISSLEDLRAAIDECHRCAQERNPLRHIYGDGMARSPDFCFVLINPTHSNISSHPSYRGLRFPFIGVRSFWRVLNRAGFIQDAVMAAVEHTPWQEETTRVVLEELQRQRIYLTNLVKCAQPHPNVPARSVFLEDMPLFRREMSLVMPLVIVAFGQLTTRILTGEQLHFGQHFRRFLADQNSVAPLLYKLSDTESIPVMPNYFPVGRGNPRLAVEVLKRLKSTGPPRIASAPSWGMPERGTTGRKFKSAAS